MLNQDADEGLQLFGRGAIRDEEQQIQLTAPPIVERKLPFEQASPIAVEAVRQRGHHAPEEALQVLGTAERLAESSIRKVAQGFVVGHGHTRCLLSTRS